MKKARTLALLAVPSAAAALIFLSLRGKAAEEKAAEAAEECTPQWQCEPWQTGHETDGCGNIRPNTACLPTAPPLLGIALPEIKDATGHSDGVSTTALFLWTNRGGYGYTRFEIYKTGVSGVLVDAPGCFDTRTGLKYLSYMDIDHQALDFYDVRAMKCSSVALEECPAAACSQEVQASSILGIAVKQYDITYPDAPPNLIITPKDSAIDVSWCPVNNIEVFAYYVEISYAGTVLVSGYTLSSERILNVGGLSNWVEYGVSIRAISHSRVAGDATEGTGIPSGG